jgi:Holliday junction resolvase RusA-like endonuclease
MGPWTVEIPIPQPFRNSLLNANQRRHWRHRQRVTKSWREETGWRARAARVPSLERARIVVEFSFGDQRRRDVNNYQPTAKAIVDGLVDVGLLPDDNDRHLVGPDLRRVEHPGLALVRVVVTDLEDPGRSAA